MEGIGKEGSGSCGGWLGVPPSQVTRSSLYQLLKTPLDSREQWMAQTMVFLTKDFDFFRKHAPQHYECSKYFTLQAYEPGDEIVEYNSDPDNFFLLLEGEVAVFLKKTLGEVDQGKQRRASMVEEQRDPDERLLQRHHFVGEVCRFKKIAVLSEGAPFGELGIIYNRPRIALIVARTQCQVAVMARQHYLDIFCEAENQERKLKREFIFGHFFAKFRDLKYQLCEALLYSFKERKYAINELICREEDPFSGFFLVKSGQVVLSRKDPTNSDNRKPKQKLISIVSQGHLLCYEQWRRSLSDGQPARLLFSARVTSSQARVYSLSLQQMQKIYNIQTLVMDGEWNGSYAQYLNCHTPRTDLKQHRPKAKEQLKPNPPKSPVNNWKVRDLERAMQEAMVNCLLTTEKRKPEKKKSSMKCLPTGRSMGIGSDIILRGSGKETARVSENIGKIKKSKKKESILSSIFASALVEDK